MLTGNFFFLALTSSVGWLVQLLPDVFILFMTPIGEDFVVCTVGTQAPSGSSWAAKLYSTYMEWFC